MLVGTCRCMYMCAFQGGNPPLVDRCIVCPPVGLGVRRAGSKKLRRVGNLLGYLTAVGKLFLVTSAASLGGRTLSTKGKRNGGTPPLQAQLAQISATTKRRCRPRAGPPLGTKKQGGGSFCSPPPPPRCRVLVWWRKSGKVL